jgi:hypothetical protein
LSIDNGSGVRIFTGHAWLCWLTGVVVTRIPPPPVPQLGIEHKKLWSCWWPNLFNVIMHVRKRREKDNLSPKVPLFVPEHNL